MDNPNNKKSTILGLDLGTTSIGWALVTETRNQQNQLLDADILKLGVRVNPLTTDEKNDFESGKPLSTNAERTLKRGARRNLQRYKLRRRNLIEILRTHNIIGPDTPLTETGSGSTHETWRLRAKAARQAIELHELARVLLAINKKRGYKSNRKAKDDSDGIAIDGMAVAKELYDNGLTPGQYALKRLEAGRSYIPDFYRSDLKAEFDAVWKLQAQQHPDILDAELYQALQGQGMRSSATLFRKLKGVTTADIKGKRHEKKLQAYQWRATCLKEIMDIDIVAHVLVDINKDINQSSGTLGRISDRSKELYIDQITVGEYCYRQLEDNFHARLKSQTFYRQDYLDEFEQIWTIQSAHHPSLTPALKEEIRDVVIFYQRKLKSQKGLLSFCTFEQKQVPLLDCKGKPKIDNKTGLARMRTIGLRVSPKSSPLFQEFKIWQQINNLVLINEMTGETLHVREMSQEARQALFQELNLRKEAKYREVLKVLSKYCLLGKLPEWTCNYDKIEGNRTNAALLNIFETISENEGIALDLKKMKAPEIHSAVQELCEKIGAPKDLLQFDALLPKEKFELQNSYLLWHLLYSAEEDGKIDPEDKLIYGNNQVKLKKKLCQRFGLDPDYAKLFASILLEEGHGSLSAKAQKKILPFLQQGLRYDEACREAGYNHSHSLTTEDNDKRQLESYVAPVPRNSLRNPVVEKILNQMANLINMLIDAHGKPDEIRLELARELKKSAKERKEATSSIAENTRKNDRIRNIIRRKFKFEPTRNDVIRYKLWEELRTNGHKTIFSNYYIAEDKIFSKDIDIEHILPKALVFDDAFSNKTLAQRYVNEAKSKRTALDYMTQDRSSELEVYTARVERLYREKAISRTKRNKLLMSRNEIPEGFIERDLRNSQYIAAQAQKMLQKIVRPKVVVTSGKITNRLRSDWNLINVMKELSLPTYRALGLTAIEKRYDSGKEEYKDHEIIQDWTKRDDHRHHAMDALTVAFTSRGHVQYLNHLNARRDEQSANHPVVQALEDKLIETRNHKQRFRPPMENFRSEAKKHIESILVSIKAKNKVLTKNINKTKLKKGYHKQIALTPRGQLHKETIYGRIKRPEEKPSKLTKRWTLDKVALIMDPQVRSKVVDHLERYGQDPSVAFAPATLRKDPILHKGEPIKEILCYEEIYTKRVDIKPELKLAKVIDPKIRKLLDQRVKDYGDPKAAFSNLEENPIWLNKEKGICIKRVTIRAVNNAQAIHIKRDHHGQAILTDTGSEITTDFIQTGNNHHVAIYRDAEGKLHERVVSFYEAVHRGLSPDLDIVDRDYNADQGWKFLYTLKQNEMFVFPDEQSGFYPHEEDLMDPKNASRISPHLFRVQKIASRNYLFNHHTNSTAITANDLKTKKMLEGKQFRLIQSTTHLKGMTKVRIDHLGRIVQVGEYH